ncbi:glycosyltransferase family 4 protein [Demequina sp. NBRC 110052]|uniref:glycosyltransferase family 4 protein n=1 Tax=Demequina sp. NBRC 110052 TaxID=1570341 RepID=UPI0013563564|nr:glycosyltransferase family 4 protein [Demequina sp. NBRC 110052]
MKIAIVFDCYFPVTTGGGERLYGAMARDLGALGHDVEYLTAVDPTTAEAPAGFRATQISPGLHLYDADGVRRPQSALVFAWALFKALRKRRRSLDAVVVSALPVLNLFAARIALAGSRTAIVADYLEVWGRKQWLEYSGGVVGTVAWVLQRFAVLASPAASCHSLLTEDRLRVERFRGTMLRSPGLIDNPAQVEARAEADAPPYIVYAGRHIADKRVEALPAAVAIARQALPELRLVILGKGPTTPRVEAAIAAAGAEGWATMPGFVSESELAELMGGASALVNPSKREGYGLVVVEAAGRGTPSVLVADPDNAAMELVEEGVNGFVAPSIAAEDLAAAIVRAASGGTDLRRSTRDWYDDAVVTKTVTRTVERLDAYLRATVEALRGVK